LAVEDRKKIVEEFFRLVAEGKSKEGLRFFAPDCKQHNPYVKVGMDALLEAMGAVQKDEGPKHPDADFGVKHVLADSDMVAVHTNLISTRSRPSEGGLRQIHLFRFGKDNKIVEYWDITQTIESTMPNAAGAF
jgi:predicted SnoaL-like aldol condensation-catalyzing enzyme